VEKGFGERIRFSIIQTFLPVNLSRCNLLICEVNLEEIIGSELRSYDLLGVSLAKSHVSRDCV